MSEEDIRVAGILADLREDGIVSRQQNGDGFQIERKIPSENKRFIVSFSPDKSELTLIEKTFSMEHSGFLNTKWIWEFTSESISIIQKKVLNNGLSITGYVINEFLNDQIYQMVSHLSSGDTTKKEENQENNQDQAEMKSETKIEKTEFKDEAKILVHKSEKNQEKDILPVEAEEISQADLKIYQQWIDKLFENFTSNIDLSKSSLRTDILRYLIETRGQFVDLDSVKELIDNEVELTGDQLMAQKLEGLDQIQKYSQVNGVHCWHPCTKDDNLSTIKMMVEQMKKQVEEVETQHLNNNQKGFLALLEKENIPMIGKLSDHIVQNGSGKIERFTKNMIREHGYKVVKSWWEEYRGLKIDF